MDDNRVNTAEFMAWLEQQQQAQRQADIASGKLLSETETRDHLRLSTKGLREARNAKRIFALCSPSGESVYPAFFTDPSLDCKVVEKICEALGDLPGESKWHFFTAPRISLGGTSPLQALTNGKVDKVLDLAFAFSIE